MLTPDILFDHIFWDLWHKIRETPEWIIHQTKELLIISEQALYTVLWLAAALAVLGEEGFLG